MRKGMYVKRMAACVMAALSVGGALACTGISLTAADSSRVVARTHRMGWK